MAATQYPKDKFAFLFINNTDPMYLLDIDNVYKMLTDYYQFLPANIWIVHQGIYAATDYPSATKKNFNALDTGTTSLQKYLQDFVTAIQTHKDTGGTGSTPDTDTDTVLFYFTGNVGTNGWLQAAGTEFDDAWLRGKMDNNTLGESELHVVMQQSQSGKYLDPNSFLDGSLFLSGNYTVTVACSSTETYQGNSTAGGYFTSGWTAGLQFKKLGSGLFADQLSPVGKAYRIHIKQAELFADAYCTDNYSSMILPDPSWSNTPDCKISGDPYQYLGEPKFLVRDGNQYNTPSDYWWESPDIVLYHPSTGTTNDLYKSDPAGSSSPYKNVVKITLRNTGTHPVRRYSIYIRIFPSGLAETWRFIQESDRSPSSVVLQPVKSADIGTASAGDFSETYQWEAPFFDDTTHECIRTEVRLPDESFDETWSIQTNDYEAQRNLDPTGDPPPPARLKDKAGNSFRGNKKHVYTIQNPFNETHEFILAIAPGNPKLLEMVHLNWLAMRSCGKEERIKPVSIGSGTQGLRFTLRGKEKKEIAVEFGLKPGIRVTKPVKLPLEILVNRNTGQLTRSPMLASLQGKYAAIAGITIVLESGIAGITGTVLDEKGNPALHALVQIETINHLRKERINVDKTGCFALHEIDPDGYRVKAVWGARQTAEQLVYLEPKDKAELKFRFDPLPQTGIKRKK